MKRVITTCLTLCLSMALALPASALEYSIEAPEDPDYGTPTSIEVVHTVDGGAMKNEDVSKNAALIPPSFGSLSADALGTGTYLTPNLAPGGMAVGTISGGNMPIVFPPVTGADPGNGGSSTSSGYTEVTDDLYYSGGYLGTLKIPAIGLSVKIYQGTGRQHSGQGGWPFHGHQHLGWHCCPGWPQPGRQQPFRKNPYVGDRGSDHPGHQAGYPYL